jgi:hypothetical protein
MQAFVAGNAQSDAGARYGGPVVLGKKLLDLAHAPVRIIHGRPKKIEIVFLS